MHARPTFDCSCIYTRVWINQVRLPILLVVSCTGKMNISLSASAPENLVSRDGFGSPVPRQPARLRTQAEFGPYLRDSSRVPRVYRATQLRTDGVHCRESADRRLVNLKVVPVTGAALAGHHGPINMRLSFAHPLMV